MNSLVYIARRLDLLSEWSGRLIAWLTLGMVAVTFAVVVLRYLFDIGWIALQESVTYMHALVFMLGAAYTLRHDGHVRVDIFYQRFGPRGKAWVDLFGTLLLLLPVTLFIAWASWDYVSSAWALKEGSPEAGGIPGVYLLKTAIPLMALLLTLQGLSLALRSLLVILGHEQDAPAHDASTEV
ncbi:MAG: TRAP transporter small permease subunit [Gammaproteobacteria bacterium]|nr:TRAP transporter small permease subunit [Gammaproteobacteria bacterium]MCW8839462.1 TRAP transporter small permease subunit [Gammaproteobacteria bacterium]MCW8958362.1 TRAP transporter small permease subunit [Gammaproteobacteria bacterium]MCW8972358.1 TRAP transporter small permease subunit [Gammaproteobacteria bacterium]MCW8992608.1 TRAP transporter small permease subunit [Gammaproteobacteria bacterium]